MNRIKYILFGILLTIIFIPNVSAKGVEITSIDLEGRSNNTVINNPPTHNGLEMNFDIGFKEINDYVKYKVVVKNDTNIDYKISNDTSFNTSNFITYKYETTGDLKANSEITVLVTITYTKEIDSAQLVNGRYSESNKAVLKLLDKDGNLANPNTGINNILIISIIILSIILITIIIKKKKTLIPVIIAILLIPTLVFAVETLRLTINVDVEILKGYKVAYLLSGYFTDEELNSHDSTYATCSKTYYIGEMTPENKLSYCYNVLYENEELYSEGERITFKQMSSNWIEDEIEDENNNWISLCHEETENIKICEANTRLLPIEVDRWWYIANPEYSPTIDRYPTLLTDLEPMNFSEIIENDWDQFSAVLLNNTSYFTMPNHNVVFNTSGLAD